MQPQRSIDADRRAFVRHETSEPARAFIGDTSRSCRLADISLGGALVEGDLGVTSNEAFVLSILDLPPLEVTVVHCGDRYFGVRFNDMERARSLVETWVRRRIEGR